MIISQQNRSVRQQSSFTTRLRLIATQRCRTAKYAVQAPAGSKGCSQILLADRYRLVCLLFVLTMALSYEKKRILGIIFILHVNIPTKLGELWVYLLEIEKIYPNCLVLPCFVVDFGHKIIITGQLYTNYWELSYFVIVYRRCRYGNIKGT